MDIWDTGNVPFETLYKIVLAMDKCGYKLELADNYWWTASYQISAELYETIYGIMENASSDLQ
jgi:hypothetical protein